MTLIYLHTTGYVYPGNKFFKSGVFMKNTKKVLTPREEDYKKVLGKVDYNPNIITCSCGSCNKHHKINTQEDDSPLARLGW